MRALGIAFLLLTIASCTKKDEAPVDTGAAIAPVPGSMDTTVQGETGGMPPITDTSRIPSDEDSLTDSLKKRR
jgi:hypothetical protein